MKNFFKAALATTMSALTVGIATKANAADMNVPAPQYKAPEAVVVYGNEAIPEMIYGAIVGGVYGDLFRKKTTTNTYVNEEFINLCGCKRFEAESFTNTTRSSLGWNIALKAGAGLAIGGLDGTIGRGIFGDRIPGLAARGVLTGMEFAALSFLDKHTTTTVTAQDIFTECTCGNFKLTGQTMTSYSRKSYNAGEFASAFAVGFAMPWVGKAAEGFFVTPALNGAGGYFGYRHELAPGS